MNILEILTGLSVKHGGILTPKIVLDEARKKTSPLHTYFEWDDSEAANQWRLAQAGSLIRKVRVTLIREDGKSELKVRAFFHVLPQQDQGAEEDDDEPIAGVYVPVKVAMENYSEQVKGQALSELKAVRRKWATVEELSKVWRVVDEIE